VELCSIHGEFDTLRLIQTSSEPARIVKALVSAGQKSGS